MKRIGKYSSSLTLSVLLATANVCTQPVATHTRMPVTLNDYINNVAKGNLGYIAAKFNVSISEAGLMAAKVFPDPELSFSYANNEDKRMLMGQSFDAGVSYQVKTGNVRKAGLELAGTETDLSRLLLRYYFRNLRADAAKSYYTSLKNRDIYNIQNETYQQLRNIAFADSIRLKTGEATELDAIQTDLEARLQFHNVLLSRAELENSLITLLTLQGKAVSDTLPDPSGNFPVYAREFQLSGLIDSAMSSRIEIMIALKTSELSEKNLNMLKANRAFEFSIEAGYSYNTIVKNEIAPAPAHNSISAGLAIPLKFSNLNKGQIQAAEYAVTQSRIYAQEAELQIITEVTQIYNNYIASREKIESFDRQLIENAEKILKGRIHAYQAGESGLIELLNARRMYTDIRNSQIESLYEYSLALIELERAAGIWDITE